MILAGNIEEVRQNQHMSKDKLALEFTIFSVISISLDIVFGILTSSSENVPVLMSSVKSDTQKQT